MDRPNTTARNYLTPPADSFWTWTDDGGAVVWVDGQPIATRAEVEAVLARLAPRGLPPFGAVVMMLAACQLGWRDSSTGKGTLAAYVKSLMDRREPVRPADVISPVVFMVGQRIQSVLRGLDAIGALPNELRENHGAKALLGEILFEQTRTLTSPEAGAVVVAELARGISGRALVHDTGALAVYDAFMLDIEALKSGLADLTEERVRARARTGLDSMVRAPELELPPAERVRRLIAELVTDRELAGLGRLAQRLVAAIHVPRRLSSPEELPLGGVSDLSNRGPLERLLVSELAHDDLTLAVRVALNEALYLRREQPPRSPPERRCILIDAGVRMWGAPRVFAAGVALALCATADRRATLEVHRARKDGVVAVNPLSREGLVSHLEALEAAPHPGAALPAWVDVLSSAPAETLSDLVLVTHEDVTLDPAFLACLPALRGTDLYCATVDGAGSFRLQLITRQGRRLISSAKIELSEVLEPTAGQERLVAEGADAHLPLMLGLPKPPLRFPVRVTPRQAAVGPNGSGIAVTRDGRLLAWKGDGRGAREVSAQVPAGPVLSVAFTGPSTAEAIVRNPHTGIATVIGVDLATDAVTVGQLATPLSAPLAVRRHGDAVLICTRGRVAAYDPGTGALLAQLTGLPARARWVNSRYFRTGGTWETAVWDGHDLTRRPVTGVAQDTVELFERPGKDGPWGITYDGRIYCSAAPEVPPKLPANLPRNAYRVVGVSQDGSRVLLDRANDHWLIDVEELSARKVYGSPTALLEPLLTEVLRTASRYNLRKAFRGVALGADGSLLLQGPHSFGVAILLTARGQLELVRTSTTVATGRVKPTQLKGIPFTRIAGPRGTRYELSEAAFADGSRVFLDGRGLLHFKSSDRELAEVSVLLNDGPLAAWTSTGHVCGPAFHVGDSRTVEPAEVWRDLKRIIGRLR